MWNLRGGDNVTWRVLKARVKDNIPIKRLEDIRFFLKHKTYISKIRFLPITACSSTRHCLARLSATLFLSLDIQENEILSEKLVHFAHLIVLIYCKIWEKWNSFFSFLSLLSCYLKHLEIAMKLISKLYSSFRGETSFAVFMEQLVPSLQMDRGYLWPQTQESYWFAPQRIPIGWSDIAIYWQSFISHISWCHW